MEKIRENLKKKILPQKQINVAVVGMSGTEKDRGQIGVGKSCLANRFVRPLNDDYYVDHISVLSQSDFSGRVVNNDHFLYWGDCRKTADDGTEYLFQVVEQTEFIDDATFQPFKGGGKQEPYLKRCTATRLQSAEKLMYVCKNQLGIEREYEQKVLHEGRIAIDGFVCVFDVSPVPNRNIEVTINFTLCKVIPNPLFSSPTPSANPTSAPTSWPTCKRPRNRLSLSPPRTTRPVRRTYERLSVCCNAKSSGMWCRWSSAVHMTPSMWTWPLWYWPNSATPVASPPSSGRR